MAIFFLNRPSPVAPPPPLHQEEVVDEDSVTDLEYYSQVAEDYIKYLPSDKVVIATLIDDTNHYIYYFEKSRTPSCYIYDLETLTTSVLFGGDNGIYCDTKLLIVGAIQDWTYSGTLAAFAAENRAPETDYTTATVVFTANLLTHELKYIDRGADATFPDPSHVVINMAEPMFGFLSPILGEEGYRKTPISYVLE